MSDLSDMDGPALVARLAAVKERALGDSRIVQAEFTSTDAGRAEAAIDRADTEAVLDECAKRLSGDDPFLLAEAHLVAGEALRLKDENQRRLGLIRAAVFQRLGAEKPTPWCPRTDGACWWCAVNLEPMDGAPDPHRPGCPWPALVVEAEKP